MTRRGGPSSLLLCLILCCCCSLTISSFIPISASSTSSVLNRGKATCLRRRDIPYHVQTPKVDDCTALAASIRDSPVSHIPQRITIPPGFKKQSGTCQLDVDIDGRPGYDFASYEEFADVVGDVVVECLGEDEYVGGREQIGANNRLRVWVTGMWDLPVEEGAEGNGLVLEGVGWKNGTGTSTGRRVDTTRRWG